MKNLFKDDSGNLSMGRMLSMLLFILCSGVWLYMKISGKVLDANDTNLILWGWGISIGGKAIQKFGEKK